MSASIGIQLISPTTGTSQGQSHQQADDNAARATAEAQDETIAGATEPPPKQPPVSTSQYVDKMA